jgi:hypothetical protein
MCEVGNDEEEIEWGTVLGCTRGSSQFDGAKTGHLTYPACAHISPAVKHKHLPTYNNDGQYERTVQLPE